ncbi:MAG: hypothetical protein KDD70_08365 [Bdellovibrionales bacterium]|nr:hypothetical protein [Bdellovibrionales bacterium]
MSRVQVHLTDDSLVLDCAGIQPFELSLKSSSVERRAVRIHGVEVLGIDEGDAAYDEDEFSSLHVVIEPSLNLLRSVSDVGLLP